MRSRVGARYCGRRLRGNAWQTPILEFQSRASFVGLFLTEFLPFRVLHEQFSHPVSLVLKSPLVARFDMTGSSVVQSGYQKNLVKK